MQRKSPQNEEYAGPSKVTLSAGKGFVLSMKLGMAGAVIGALVSFFTTQKSGFFTNRASSILKGIGLPDVSGKSAVMLGSALLGGLIGKYTGLAIGAHRVLNNDDPGREQFERLKAERDAATLEKEALKNDLHTLQAEAEVRARSHTEGTSSRTSIEPRLEAGGHAAAHEAEKRTPKEPSLS